MRALWMPWRDRRSDPIVIGRDDGSGERIPALATTPRSSPCSSSMRQLARPARPALTGGADALLVPRREGGAAGASEAQLREERQTLPWRDPRESAHG